MFWNSVYAENHVLDVQISITREAWDAMQPQRRERRPGEDGPRVDFGNQFPYAKTKVVIDGLSLPDTGMRFKGNSSYRFASRGLKRPFKIDTNRFVKGQKLHGRTKLNFSNAFLDSAFMKEKLGYELYRAAGLATPGVGWANVTLTIEGLEDQLHLEGGKASAATATIKQVAQSDIPVLLRGETGVGKDLVARSIHERSKRRELGPDQK